MREFFIYFFGQGQVQEFALFTPAHIAPIVWMIAVFRMGGGWFALFGLMFVFAGIVQAWGFFRR